MTQQTLHSESTAPHNISDKIDRLRKATKINAILTNDLENQAFDLEDMISDLRHKIDNYRRDIRENHGQHYNEHDSELAEAELLEWVNHINNFRFFQ